MDEKTLKKLPVIFAILALAILSFLIIKPLLTEIVLGLVLAYIFVPLYKKFNKKFNSKAISASLIIVIILAIIIIPLIILIPTTISQVLNSYNAIREIDLYSVASKIMPSALQSQTFSSELLAVSNSLKNSLSTAVLSLIKNSLMNFVDILFGTLVLLFTLFFALIESDKFKDYFSLIFPFPKEYREQFYDKFDQITYSMIYGQIVIGIVQGIIAGIGYYLLGVPGAFLFTVITLIAGLIPVIGPWLVWIPIDLYLFATGNTGPAISLLIYGIFVINWVDTFLRPRILSSRAQMNSAIALIGIFGGIYAFGPILGFLLGPLILAYLILIVEIYLEKKTDSIVLKKKEIINIP